MNTSYPWCVSASCWNWPAGRWARRRARRDRRGRALERNVNPEVLLTLAGLVLTLQGATLAYVVRIERRLTRLETIEELREA